MQLLNISNTWIDSLSNQKSQGGGASQSQGGVNAPPTPPERNPDVANIVLNEVLNNNDAMPVVNNMQLTAVGAQEFSMAAV